MLRCRHTTVVLRSFPLLVVLGCADAPTLVDPMETDSELALASARFDLHARRYRAFRLTATVSTTGPLEPPPPDCVAGFRTTIEGRATRLGAFHGVGTTCITEQIAPDPDPPFAAPGPPPYATARFTNPRWTLTAANGDELWLEAAGIAVISAADGTLAARGRQRIVGGTGRFERARGTLRARSVNEVGPAGPDQFSARGWIALRRPHRHRARPVSR